MIPATPRTGCSFIGGRIDFMGETSEVATIAPNPCEAGFGITIHQPESGEYSIVLHDMLGREVYRVATSSEIFVVPMLDRAAGIYALTIRTPSRAAKTYTIIRK